MTFYDTGMTDVLLVIPVLFLEVTVSCDESKEFLWVEMGSYEFLCLVREKVDS